MIDVNRPETLPLPIFERRCPLGVKPADCFLSKAGLSQSELGH